MRVSRGCFGDDVSGGMCVFGRLLIRGCLCKAWSSTSLGVTGIAVHKASSGYMSMFLSI